MKEQYKYESVATATNISDSSELPSQLVVEDGEIKTKSGRVPLFPRMAEGSVVTVVLRSDAVRLMDELNRLREENLGLRVEAAIIRSYDEKVVESVPEPSYALPKTYDEWCGATQAAPQFRAWTPDEVPLGAEVRPKRNDNLSRAVLSAVTDGGEVISPGFNPSNEHFGERGFSLWNMRALFEWRPSRFEAWRNCEVEV
jgi:hypothetical protein